MRTLLIYDIVDDRIRTKVADLCLDYALQRIQYSAFMGDIPRTLSEELWLKISKLVNNQEHSIELIPICAKDWLERRSSSGKPKPAARTVDDDDDGWGARSSDDD
ncbi:CRISPR-associated endonuclease Cas2 [Herpetosiphon llansteffanensis]|uniref:CRISPR-associated endonuclease Cas2 n=1 Tax=Herpetosiphon llansteffanensis TaxID=2094568 RepID=UPI000D7CA790|nr:CRISPR-associated endonuclease Cas2 [Herpetosiphon llansteffanensis]